jgi:hypothetical protein
LGSAESRRLAGALALNQSTQRLAQQGQWFVDAGARTRVSQERVVKPECDPNHKR